MKLTVKEYSIKFNISAQAVYQKINKGTLKYIIENGKKYIIVDDNLNVLEQVNNPLPTPENPIMTEWVDDLKKRVKNKTKKIKQLEKQLSKRDKQIEKLNKQLVKSIENEKQVLLTFITEQKKLLEQPRTTDIPPKNDDYVDIKIKKKSKKKKKK